MISRAAKSVVQSFNQRSYHVTKTHLKNLSGKIENTSSKSSKTLQLSENAEPFVEEATLPLKNLKFQNLVNRQGQNTVANAEGSPTGGKFPQVDISQAVDRRTARDTLKRISVTVVLAALKLLARIPYEQYFQVALNAVRAHHRQLSANINKDKVEELKTRIKDVLERIRKKLEELQKQRAKEAGKKVPEKKELCEQPEKKEPEKAEKKEPGKAEKEPGKAEKSEPKESGKAEKKQPEKEKKEPQDAITMAGSLDAASSSKTAFTQETGAFVVADSGLEYYSIVVVPGLPPKLSNEPQLSGASDRDFKRFTYFD